MTYKLFLDDERHPVSDDWVVCRSYNDAVDYMDMHGFPDFVSFDHDLGEYSKTGYDLAKWMVERDLDDNLMPIDFAFYVHSQNPIGKSNIENLLNKYLSFRH